MTRVRNPRGQYTRVRRCVATSRGERYPRAAHTKINKRVACSIHLYTGSLISLIYTIHYASAIISHPVIDDIPVLVHDLVVQKSLVAVSACSQTKSMKCKHVDVRIIKPRFNHPRTLRVIIARGAGGRAPAHVHRACMHLANSNWVIRHSH